MKVSTCDLEETVLNAALAGLWTDELRAHIRGCAICSEVALVANAFEVEIKTVDESVPDAGLLWWKAQLQSRRRARERALLPILVAERFAALAATTCALGILVWKLPAFGSPATWVVAALLVLLAGGAGAVYFERR
jgi:hypothetical protein